MSQPTKQHWHNYVPGRNRPDDPNPVACGRRVPKTSAHATAKFRNVETARRCRNCDQALYGADLIDRIISQPRPPQRRTRRYPACPAAHATPILRVRRRRHHPYPHARG